MNRQPFKAGQTLINGVKALCGECDLSFFQVSSPKVSHLISLHQAATVTGGCGRRQIDQMQSLLLWFGLSLPTLFPTASSLGLIHLTGGSDLVGCVTLQFIYE